MRQFLLSSPALLPSFTALHDPPAILALLQPSSAPFAGSSASLAPSLPDPNLNLDTSTNTNAGHSDSARRLHNVYLNIVTTTRYGIEAQHRYRFSLAVW
jgi:hypothetical protein